MNKKKFTIIISVLSVIVLVSLILLGLELRKQKKENKDMAQLFKIEKEEMENEYSNFAVQYDELQVRINNDSIQQKLESEKIKTQRLLEELRQVKTTDAAEIMRLKKELRTVRAVLRSYVIQIDSLNRANIALTAENKEVKQQYNEATQKISSLSEEKKSLNAKVTLAAQLDVTNIGVVPKNKRGKTKFNAKDVTKIAINFTIVKNITASTGERAVYIRITKPDNDVLTKNSSATFPYENKQLSYSIKKYVEYTGEELPVTVYWDVEEFLQAGTYRVNIFSDGNMIGSSSFTLK